MAVTYTLIPVIPVVHREHKYSQCDISEFRVVPVVKREQKQIQCNIALTNKIQAEKERKAALRPKGTQTLNVRRGKSVETQTASLAQGR
jgi:hypothetical protein